MKLLSLLPLFAAYLFFAHRRLLTFLHIFQQEEYDSRRFLRWLVDRAAFDRKASLVLLVAGALAFLSPAITSLLRIVAAIGLAVVAYMEVDPRQAGKKPLAMTKRANRLFWSSYAMLAIAALLYTVSHAPVIFWVLLVQIAPLPLALSTVLWAPYEARNNQRFIDEARQKLLDLKPTIIGVTGSFGKTSVKHILGHLLNVQAPALVTPGSVNTELGITRIVREKLAARDKFFVCEMGAYGIGSIAKLCRLAPPDVGVITAIGHAHYERFKSLETVVKAKFELAEATMAKGGRLVVHESVLVHAHAAAFVASHRDRVMIVGEGVAADCRILAAGQTVEGAFADLGWKGAVYRLQAKLYGGHHAGNMAIAFATAAALGLEPADLVSAMASTPQIKHRSEVKAHASGAVLIDDAYNSNPSGFAGALPLLDLLKKNDGRRILITPGMVELGEAHDAEHAKIGELAAAHVDILVPVIPDRLRPLVTAYKTHSATGQVAPQSTLQGALDWMSANLMTDDVVLMENDLPDLYERKLSL